MTKRLHGAHPSEIPRCCTIAGSDSGGGAGIQADLKTFLALGAYGLSVVTALTAQNTKSVTAIHVPPTDFLRQQIRSVSQDIRIDAFKLGMLANAEVIAAVADELKQASPRHDTTPIVLDPVMVSTSGSLLLSHDAIRTLIDQLLPRCTLLTPNIPEAKTLLAHARHPLGETESQSSALDKDNPIALDTVVELMAAAKELADLGPQSVLIKGGHQPLRRSDLEDALAQLNVVQQNHSQRPSQSDGKGLAADPQGLEPGAQLMWNAADEGATIVAVRADGAPHSEVLRRLTPDEGDNTSVILDVLYTKPEEQDDRNGAYTLFVGPKLTQACTHGTGCTLSSALAACLSVEDCTKPLSSASLARACWKSINYVQAAIVRGYEDLGSGPGALDHAVSVAPRGVLSSSAQTITSQGFVRDHVQQTLIGESYANKLSPQLAKTLLGSDPTPFTTRLLSHSTVPWKRYVRHPFIVRLSRSILDPSGDDSLPIGNFLYFLKQDYHFLLHYSRIWASAASCARSFDEAQLFLDLAKGMASEATGHVKLCEGYFGLKKEDLEAEQEGAATIAYTRLVLDVARGSEGTLALLTATMPCLLGYAEMAFEMGVLLGEHYPPREDTTTAPLDSVKSRNGKTQLGLRKWWAQYAGEEYCSTVRAGLAKLEEEAAQVCPSPIQMAQLQKIWDAAVRLEAGMWDEAVAHEAKGAPATLRQLLSQGS